MSSQYDDKSNSSRSRAFPRRKGGDTCTQQQKRSIRRLRREPVRSWLVAAASAVVLAALWLSEPATAAVDAGTAVGHNCHEFVAFPEIPYQEADDLVPDKYLVSRTSARIHIVPPFFTPSRARVKTAIDRDRRRS
jgi:hypothetical protein